MKKQVGIAGVLGMLVVSGFGSSVVAQGALAIGGTASNFGNRSLAPGFMPDPVTVSITSGGSLNVSTMNLAAGCVGFVTRNPDFILRMSGASASLKVKFMVPNAQPNTPSDTTLVVNTGSGQWRCNDDSVGANPVVNLGGAGAGQYDIWVGSYQAGANARGQLIITEL